MITFDTAVTTVAVYQDNILIGNIIGNPNTYYRYYPLGGEPGEKYHGLIQCKKSITG